MTYLIFDSNYLCTRAFYAFPDLEHDGRPTGMAFGFFSDIERLSEQYGTDRILFAFDSDDDDVRMELLPSYKESRRASAAEDDFVRAHIHDGIRLIRDKVLPCIGYRNIFLQKAYEADDIIASLVCTLEPDATKVVVSSDEDMLQLLQHNVEIWNPRQKQAITETSFELEWGLKPGQWPLVKAIAGCKSDEIPGVNGVGNKTAAKFLTGMLKPGSAKRKAIEAVGPDVIDRNLRLTTLPYPGTKKFCVQPDAVTEDNWNRAMKKLGIKRLMR